MTPPPPRLLAPPRHLLPLPVQDAHRRVSHWRLFSALLFVVWLAGMGVGMIPMLLELIDGGWQAVAGPVAAGVLGLPGVWGTARAIWGRTLATDRALLALWRHYPDDVRWSSSLVLADKMDRASAGDADTRAILRRLVGALFGLFQELAALDDSIAADREIASLGGDPQLHDQLLTLRRERDAQLSRLVDALRELHLGFARRHVAPPAVRSEVRALLDQLDAEREVEGLGPPGRALQLDAQARVDLA